MIRIWVPQDEWPPRIRIQADRRSVLIASLACSMFLGLILLWFHPTIAFRPVCFDSKAFLGIGAYKRVDGEIEPNFLSYLSDTLRTMPVDHFAREDRILITGRDWLDGAAMRNITFETIENWIGDIETFRAQNPPGEGAGSEDPSSECAFVRWIAIRDAAL
ncbi:MAG: hypothetical protein AB7G39_11805 [Alphaproteobacteria bacterium]